MTEPASGYTAERIAHLTKLLIERGKDEAVAYMLAERTAYDEQLMNEWEEMEDD